jgi:DNA-directed RNA polymerase beta' subunit
VRENFAKRRDQSGRTPISADVTISTDELIVPRAMANNLTIPEKVTSFNIDWLQELVEEDKVNFVNRAGTSEFINMSYATHTRGFVLHWGDKILRNTPGGKIEIDPYPRSFTSTGHVDKEGSSILENGDIIVRHTPEGRVEHIPAYFSKRKIFTLKIGDTVGRYLMDNDMVLFNQKI